MLLRFQIKGRFSCPYLVCRLVTVYTILLTHFFHGQLLFTICACFTKGTARAKQKGSIFTRGSLPQWELHFWYTLELTWISDNCSSDAVEVRIKTEKSCQIWELRGGANTLEYYTPPKVTHSCLDVWIVHEKTWVSSIVGDPAGLHSTSGYIVQTLCHSTVVQKCLIFQSYPQFFFCFKIADF